MQLILASITAIICCMGVNGNEEFDFLVFAQQWPQSICVGANLSHEHTCQVNQNVTTWSNHGLWPTKKGSKPPGPNNCNSTSKFNLKALDPIRPQLMMYWSNLYKETPMDALWEHEWKKHGTCASQLPQLGSEFKYFSSALQLNRKFDLFKIFGDHGIVPRDNYVYQYAEALKIAESLGNATLQCYFNKFTKTQYLSQIEICLSKNLEIVNCNDYPAWVQHQSKRNDKSLMKHRVMRSIFGTKTKFMEKGFQNVGQKFEPFDFHGLENCFDTEPIAYPILKH